MKNKNIREEHANIALLVLLFLFGAWIFLFMPTTGLGQTINYSENYTVNTTVNITNSAPIITYITIDSPISLVAYSNKSVSCNVTVYDYDNDTVTVNGTFFTDDGIVFPESQDDGNNHYSNSSCSRTTAQDREMNYTCVFHVLYYADNTTNWVCNITVKDDQNALTSNKSTSATVEPLVAIKMDDLLDYGDLAVNEISSDTLANITNAGNRDANISVKGWAVTEGDGLAFNCSFGTIALSYERYNNTAGSGYTDMYQAQDNLVMIPELFVPQRTSESADSINSTYWKVQIPVGAGGICNGKLLFSASDRGN